MSVDLGRPFPPAISSNAPLQERYDNLHEQVDILASWILNNVPKEIGRGNHQEGESACEVALRLLRLQICENAASGIVAEIVAERERQDAIWGGPEHDDEHEVSDWARYIANHNDEAFYAGTRADMHGGGGVKLPSARS